MVYKVCNQELVAKAFGMVPAAQQSQYATHLGPGVNHNFTRRSKARCYRAVKFRPIGVYGGIDRIEHLDAKQRPLGQTVYAITSGGVEAGVEIKGQDRSGRYAHRPDAGRLTVRRTCERTDNAHSHQTDTFHGLGTFRISSNQSSQEIWITQLRLPNTTVGSCLRAVNGPSRLDVFYDVSIRRNYLPRQVGGAEVRRREKNLLAAAMSRGQFENGNSRRRGISRRKSRAERGSSHCAALRSK
jgi:hypothetical protein